MASKNTAKFSIYLSYLLRHAPQDANLDMDHHGWVNVDQLLKNINENGRYVLTASTLQEIVVNDSKGRYRFSEDGNRIKACQGHSLPWVEPELQEMTPPEFLYHGTTTEAKDAIMASGAILRMQRHAVHLTEDFSLAWKSACRRKGKHPVVLKIAAKVLSETGVVFGKSENDVWCCEQVPVAFIQEIIYHQRS